MLIILLLVGIVNWIIYLLTCLGEISSAEFLSIFLQRIFYIFYFHILLLFCNLLTFIINSFLFKYIYVKPIMVLWTKYQYKIQIHSMLKLNRMKQLVFALIHYLNTSHVKVKLTPLLASSLYLYTINPRQSISFQHFFQLITIFQTFDFSSITVISLENSFLYKYVFSILICCS